MNFVHIRHPCRFLLFRCPCVDAGIWLKPQIISQATCVIHWRVSCTVCLALYFLRNLWNRLKICGGQLLLELSTKHGSFWGTFQHQDRNWKRLLICQLAPSGVSDPAGPLAATCPRSKNQRPRAAHRVHVARHAPIGSMAAQVWLRKPCLALKGDQWFSWCFMITGVTHRRLRLAVCNWLMMQWLINK